MDSTLSCICGDLEEIRGFQSPLEYKRFLEYLGDRVKDNDLVEIVVESRYADSKLLSERWFKCMRCNQKWRLVAPDFPFKGLWEKL
jgi:hypothetical protein